SCQPGAVEIGTSHRLGGEAVDAAAEREDLRLFEEGQNVGVFDEVVLDRLGGRLSFLRIGFGGQSIEEVVGLRVDGIVVGKRAAGAVEEDRVDDRGVVRA